MLKARRALCVGNECFRLAQPLHKTADALVGGYIIVDGVDRVCRADM
jgi:hypothetical protein